MLWYLNTVDILDKRVCGTETNGSMPIPEFISLRYIIERSLSGSNGQVHNSEGGGGGVRLSNFINIIWS